MGEKKGCKITVIGKELKLAYPHTSSMHKCDHKAQGQISAETEKKDDHVDGTEGEEDDDGMLSMFD